MRRVNVRAAEVARVRAALGLTQKQFAECLGITRWTVMRGEKRGLEVPLHHPSSSRAAFVIAWLDLKRAAIARKSHSARVPRKKSHKRKRLRLSRDLLRARRGKSHA